MVPFALRLVKRHIWWIIAFLAGICIYPVVFRTIKGEGLTTISMPGSAQDTSVGNIKNVTYKLCDNANCIGEFANFRKVTSYFTMDQWKSLIYSQNGKLMDANKKEGNLSGQSYTVKGLHDEDFTVTNDDIENTIIDYYNNNANQPVQPYDDATEETLPQECHSLGWWHREYPDENVKDRGNFKKCALRNGNRGYIPK